MVAISIRNLSKSFGAVTAIHDVSFEVRDGEFLTLLGPSGCGKSTTLSFIAGLDRPDTGVIEVGGQIFVDSENDVYVPPEKRNGGLVFQSYALWPHMTIGQNVAYPLKLRKVRGTELRRRTEAALELVELGAYGDRYPHQLSGGQQQRAALARTLVYEPSVLLLDEPLSNLDAKLRERARSWLSGLRDRVKLTTIYVTHDQSEALALSDRIVVMNAGRIAQIGTPQEIYESPADAFVADFIGVSSFLTATVRGYCEASGAAMVELWDGQVIKSRLDKVFEEGQAISLALRPEKMKIAKAPEDFGGATGTSVKCNIQARVYQGARYQYDVEVAGSTIKMETEAKMDEGIAFAFIPDTGLIAFKSRP